MTHVILKLGSCIYFNPHLSRPNNCTPIYRAKSARFKVQIYYSLPVIYPCTGCKIDQIFVDPLQKKLHNRDRLWVAVEKRSEGGDRTDGDNQEVSLEPVSNN